MHSKRNIANETLFNNQVTTSSGQHLVNCLVNKLHDAVVQLIFINATRAYPSSVSPLVTGCMCVRVRVRVHWSYCGSLTWQRVVSSSLPNLVPIAALV